MTSIGHFFRIHMANSYFRFKQFTIQQDCTAMKVGTDGVLLGAWSNVKNDSTILDIGTGTGLIALMAAQRTIGAKIDAIEIDESACMQANENVKQSPWKERIAVIQCAVQDFHPDRLYDTILCNPPFFINSTKTPDSSRTIARHCDTLSHSALLKSAIRLLTANGSLQVILPTEEAIAFMQEAEKSNLYTSRLTRVLPNPNKPTKRYLLEFSRILSNLIEDEIIIEWEHHKYCDRYIHLTKEFYLNL